jgi:glycosyltransferase involved in cell wall biosynthesis
MNILYIHQYFTTRDGDGGTRSYEFSRHLIEKGHNVTMVASTYKLLHMPEMRNGKLINRVNIDGIDVIGIRVGYSNYMGYTRRGLAFLQFMFASLWACLWVKDVDIVYASSTPITVGVVGWLAALKHGKPFVFELRDLWPEYIEDFDLTHNRLVLDCLKYLADFLYRKARQIVVISDSMNRRVQSLYKHARGKVVTIPLGADMVSDYGGEDVPLPGIDKRDFLVVYTGALGFVNAVHWLLRVAEKLKGKGVSFVIAGEGKTRPELEAMKKDMGLDNVHFLGKITKRNVYSLIRKGDACVITNRYKDENGRVYIYSEDSLTNKFFDYIAAGKPVLINHESESSKYIERYSIGVKLSFNDYDEAAAEICKLKENPGLARKMGENARRLAFEKFDRTNLAEEWERMLHQAATRANGMKPAESVGKLVEGVKK